jgi:hypothetical protein
MRAEQHRGLGLFARQRRCDRSLHRHPIAKLILEAPYTSTVDVASEMLWYVPVSLLMRDQLSFGPAHHRRQRAAPDHAWGRRIR